MEITSITQLNLNATYTHLDYISWKFRERVELLLGKVFLMSPAASTTHQHCSSILAREFGIFFKGSTCRVFQAPFDVFFLGENGAPDTIFQPDLVVVCDPQKLKERGCYGAPDLVVEILSPSSAARDVRDKYFIYEAYGVKEYWIVQPLGKTVTIHTLTSAGKFQPLKTCTLGDSIDSPLFHGLQIDLDEASEIAVSEPDIVYSGNAVRMD